MAPKVKKKSKANTNQLGNPRTVYLPDDLVEKADRLIAHRQQLSGSEKPVSLTGLIRALLREAPEPSASEPKEKAAKA